ncbi:helix-turn-helix domain-containing protein [Sulfitobacter sp. G21635-S1]|uniref:helix-turn-helix domain-containing protein n=1 Tax=Rhodobacterales TaxID=204455 RepID=UPI0022AF38C6|nr:helix-turn-helix transcriptional regulator [Sulfitobacter sp. G21635-S1]MCZ4258698.1 helix-turn-helix transcriptional regulator [Sulfitobacter sp. G21635-S1]
MGLFNKAGDIGTAARMLHVRNSLGYAQSVMAAKCDVSDSTYKNYERARREPTVSFALKFCENFDVDIAWLLQGKGEPKSEYRDERYQKSASED